MPPVKVMRKPTAVGAYIFAGGFTVGVTQAGFDVLCHLEESDYGVDTFKRNFPQVPVYYPPEAWPIDSLPNDVDLWYGNPPCAAWSVAGYTKTQGTDKWRTDDRVKCTVRHFKLLLTKRPKVWIWESVTQAYTKGREFVDELARQALGAGYSVTYLLHDAQWLGLPQVRKRFFMICHRVELDVPELLWTTPPEPMDFLPLASTVSDQYSGKSSTPLRQFTPEVIAKVLPGERLTKYWQREVGGDDPDKWERHPTRGHVIGRPSFGHCRLPLGRPGGAVVGYGMIHPVENRFISTEEMQVLSGFPPDYVFTPSAVFARASEIARGVCPPVGRWVAEIAKAAIIRGRVVTDPSVREVDLRKPPVSLSQKRVPGAMPKTVVKQRSVNARPVMTKNQLIGRLGHPGSKPQDLDRQYDTTQLRANSHGRRVHRDYAAHFFRWGWASRFIKARQTRVLDVGCGQDLPLVYILANSLAHTPAAYVGVDLNKVNGSGISWVEAIHDEFDFPGGGWRMIKKSHKPFDLISCFEVIEHMHEESGQQLLIGMRECLVDGGQILLSTPVYNGQKMAANHLKEYTVDELTVLIKSVGLEVVERFGTFASWNDIRKVCTDSERRLLEDTGRFYGGDVLACFLAPKYPGASRNNAWVLRRA